MSKAYVFSIEEFSTFDGPGIRTTVFLKGCPLRCEWCHNPEGQSFENEIIKSQFGCLGCGECIKAADMTGEKTVLTEKSVAVCPNRLLRFAGTEYTPESLVEKLCKNIPLLNTSGGGITFSGGEPLSNHEFLTDCLKLLDGETHRALQTSGYAADGVFKSVLGYVDYVLYDLKIIDEQRHQRYTGVSNGVILHNFDTLVKSGKPFVVRTPLIPTVTDTAENLAEIAHLLKFYGICEIDLLPYNKVAGGKYAAIGCEYKPSFDETVPPDPKTEIFEKYSIKANIL